MVKYSAYRLEETQWTHGGHSAPLQSRFWMSFLAFLLLATPALGLSEDDEMLKPSTWAVERTSPTEDQNEALFNQTVDVDDKNNLVTIHVLSAETEKAVVQFDVKNGVTVYKPADQDSCFLQKMEVSHYAHVRFLRKNPSFEPGNKMRKHTELLELDSEVDASTLSESVQDLCRGRYIFEVKKANEVMAPNNGDARARRWTFAMCLKVKKWKVCVSIFYK